jgi:diguanylate cyclase (GGDEF)-like protein
MQKAKTPASERARQAAVDELELGCLGTDQRFECYARLASQALQAPMSALSIISRERQLFKASVGLRALGTGRAESFCSHTILDTGPMVVPDARLDSRFADNPLVCDEPKIRFYLGAPVRAPAGTNLGAICVLDHQPRAVTDTDLRVIADIAHMIENELLLYSRHAFDEIAAHSWRRAHSAGAPSGLILVSVDRYLSRSRAWGKRGVDQILRVVTQCVHESCGTPDCVAGRIHDDRIALLVTHRTAPEMAELGERIRARVQACGASENGFGRDVTVSVGVSYHEPGLDGDRGIMDLIARAHEALCRAKSSGGNRCLGVEPVDEIHPRRGAQRIATAGAPVIAAAAHSF